MLTLDEFIRANQPEAVTVSLEEIRQAVAKLPAEEGWQVITDPGAHPDFDQPNFRFAVVRFTGESEPRRIRGGWFPKIISSPKWEGQIFGVDSMKLPYHSHHIDGDVVEYEVSWWMMPRPLTRERLGVQPVRVDLPEKVVRMPIPEWVWAYSDDGQAWVNTPWVFESQAKVLWHEFLSQRPS